jgi:hypothetical protein
MNWMAVVASGLAVMLVGVMLVIGGCAPVIGAAAWGHHDYDWHCYGPRAPSGWCRDHR